MPAGCSSRCHRLGSGALVLDGKPGQHFGSCGSRQKVDEVKLENALQGQRVGPQEHGGLGVGRDVAGGERRRCVGGVSQQPAIERGVALRRQMQGCKRADETQPDAIMFGVGSCRGAGQESMAFTNAITN